MLKRYMAFVLLLFIAGNAWAQLAPEQQAAKDKQVVLADTDSRLKGLDGSGLLECSLKPKLSGFLVGEERARLEEIETYDPDLEANAEEAELFRRSLSSTNPIDSLDLNRYERQQLTEGQRLVGLRVEKQALEAKARSLAEERCSLLEDGQYY